MVAHRSKRAAGLVSLALALAPGLVLAPAASAHPEHPRAACHYPSCDMLHARGHARGSVVTIHGGGWGWVGRAAMGAERPEQRRFADAGYDAYNVDYARGRRSLRSLLDRFDAIFERARKPVCVEGSSAGAQLALLVAAHRPRHVACAISQAGPTDLRHILDDVAAPQRPDWRRRLDRIRPLAGFSPIRYAARIGARALLAYAPDDRLVPPVQAHRFLRADPAARSLRLRSGGAERFVHSRVAARQMARLRRVELRFVAERMRG